MPRPTVVGSTAPAKKVLGNKPVAFTLSLQRKAKPLMRKAIAMVKLEDFPSYSVGVAKGRRETIAELGEKRFGKPDKQTLEALESIKDLDRLRQLTDRLLDVESWQELMAPAHNISNAR